uniref:Uncharacterized protein n=1 Tax=Arundo donax TaxID=35708 RepID=A0A0A9F7R3_ARUDO
MWARSTPSAPRPLRPPARSEIKISNHRANDPSAQRFKLFPIQKIGDT